MRKGLSVVLGCWKLKVKRREGKSLAGSVRGREGGREGRRERSRVTGRQKLAPQHFINGVVSLGGVQGFNVRLQVVTLEMKTSLDSGYLLASRCHYIVVLEMR